MNRLESATKLPVRARETSVSIRRKANLEVLALTWRLEPRTRKEVVKCFLELAILCRLKCKSMTGYGISALLSSEVDVTISPDTIYHALYSMERKGLLQCVRDKPGRLYSLTENGRKIAETIPSTVQDIQVFMKKLLCS